ncbi:MAG TPA: hypothetical protein VFE24_09795 [Pirellulales bacterium]|nr:hypothetical protein [Pirellulales bacterium]
MKVLLGSLAIALAGLLFQYAQAEMLHGGGGYCEKCGCRCDITCRLVCDTKKVNKTCYCCKLEPFCVGHECPWGQVHECEPPACPCDTCNPPCACEQCLIDLFHCDNAHAPCADSLNKKKLVKYTETKVVPYYHWVAEKTCPQCGCCSECALPTPAGVAPGVEAPVPAPTPAPSGPPLNKSTRYSPATNVPASYHAGDEAAASDSIFRSLAK